MASETTTGKKPSARSKPAAAKSAAAKSAAAKSAAAKSAAAKATAVKKPAPNKIGTTAKKPAAKTAKPAAKAAKPAASKSAATRSASAKPAAKKSTPAPTAAKTANGVRPWSKSYPEGIVWDINTDLTPVHQRVAARVKQAPGALALDFLGSQTSYGDLWKDVERFCGGLQARLDVKKGDRVALLMPNSPHYVVAYYAVLMAGGIVVNCNPLYSVSELTHIVKDSGAEILITLDLKLTFEKAEVLAQNTQLETVVVGNFAEALPGLKSFLFKLVKRGDIADVKGSKIAGKVVHFGDLRDRNDTPAAVTIDPEKDIAVQQYTGGTTGVPKGAMLSHANIAANVSQIDAWGCGLFNPPSKVVAVLPFFHIFAMTVCLNTPLTSGSSVVMMPRFDIKEFFKLLRRTRANVLPAVPTLLHAIATYKELKKDDVSSIEVAISGGAALPNETRSNFGKVSNAILAEGYGLTEASPVVCCAALRIPSKPMSIGLPLPATDIRFVDVDSGKAVKQGERGELQVKGPQVMVGYFKEKEKSRDAFQDGWLRTGDVGYMDEDGYVFLVDRIKDLIISSGFNIYPRNIEEALIRHPDVDECNVIGVPDEHKGEVPVAFVKPVKGVTPDAEKLQAFLAEKLSKLELPREIIFKDELPKTLVGKLSKKELREEYADQQSGSRGA